jgi:hypothetical protein
MRPPPNQLWGREAFEDASSKPDRTRAESSGDFVIDVRVDGVEDFILFIRLGAGE